MWSPDFSSRAGVAIERMMSSIAAMQASGWRRGTGSARPLPGPGSRRRDRRGRAVAVVLALGDRAVLDQNSKRPAVKRAIGRRHRCGSACVGLRDMAWPRINRPPIIHHSINPSLSHGAIVPPSRHAITFS